MNTTKEQRDFIKNFPTELSDLEDYQNANFIAEQEVRPITFDLRRDVDTSLAKEITQTLHNAEEDRVSEERMGQWRLQFKSIETDAERIKIAMEFDIDILIEALTRNVTKVDDTYLMFCKKEDRKPMHSDALNQIKEDMKSEYKEIQPYLDEAENFIKMLGRE